MAKAVKEQQEPNVDENIYQTVNVDPESFYDKEQKKKVAKTKEYIPKEPQTYEVLPSGTPRGYNVWVSGKHTYMKNQEKGHKTYLTCSWYRKRKIKCPGRAMVDEKNKLFFLMQPHSCPDSQL